jgi:hypothetical protein
MASLADSQGEKVDDALARNVPLGIKTGINDSVTVSPKEPANSQALLADDQDEDLIGVVPLL